MPIIKKKNIKKEGAKTIDTCSKCKGNNLGKDKKTKEIYCKDCKIKAINLELEARKSKQVPYWSDLKPKLEYIAERLKKQTDIILTPIKLAESRDIDCAACGFPLASNHCYLSKNAYYCWRDGDIIETYYKQLHGLESKEEIRVVFTMRRYSLKDNRFGRWLIEGVIDNFGKKYCGECVFINNFHNRAKWGNKLEEYKPCFLSIKILQTDFVVDDTIRSSVAYYCKEHCSDWIKEMAKSKDDVIGYDQNIIQRMESKILEIANKNIGF